MTVLQAVILGVVQGLTEFIPVSSTAHLELTQRVLGIGLGASSRSFDIVLHLGTALALIVVFARDLAGMIEETLRWLARKDARNPEDRALIVPVILGTIPGVLVGLLLLRKFEESRTLATIGISMITACIYFFLSEAIAAWRRKAKEPRRNVTAVDALGIGVAQAAAGLMAGFSRSGFTIATGLLRGLSRERSARFSFLLALPIIVGAGAKTAIDLHRHPEPGLSAAVLLSGLATSAVFGFLAVRVLLAYLKSHSLRPFGAYLGILGVVLLLVA